MVSATPRPPTASRTFATGAATGAASAAAIAALVLLSGCGGERPATVAVGEPVPAYAAPTLAGDTLSLASLEGDVVLFNVWATWCEPCREEMPDLQDLSDTFEAQGVRVVGVSVDQGHADAAVERFVEEYDIGFTILRDPRARVERTFRTVGVPETFLIDRDGTLVARWLGPIRPDVVRKALRATLADSVG